MKWKLDTLLTFHGKNRVFIQTKVAWTTICRRNENITRNKHAVCKLGISKYWDECETEFFTIINLKKFWIIILLKKKFTKNTTSFKYFLLGGDKMDFCQAGKCYRYVIFNINWHSLADYFHFSYFLVLIHSGYSIAFTIYTKA